jgi:hypothetical protein
VEDGGMSKRYGRNQRRKAKAEIAELSHLVEAKGHQIRALQYQGARNQEIVNRTAEVLGNYFITLQPEEREIPGLRVLETGLRIHDSQYEKGVFDGRISGDANNTAVMERVLPIIHGTSFADELRRRVHFRIYYNGHPVGYAIDEQSLALMPREYAERKIAGEMARYLMREVCG